MEVIADYLAESVSGFAWVGKGNTKVHNQLFEDYAVNLLRLKAAFAFLHFEILQIKFPSTFQR